MDGLGTFSIWHWLLMVGTVVMLLNARRINRAFDALRPDLASRWVLLHAVEGVRVRI